MNKIKAFFSGLFKNVWFGIKTCFLASKFYFSMKLIILMFTTLIPLVNLWLWKEVLNGIVDFGNSKQTVIVCLVIYLALQLATYLIDQFDNYVQDRYSDELKFYIEEQMMDKTSRMDLSFFDSAKMGDKVRHARNNFLTMMNMSWLVFDIISAFINVVATLIIVCTYKLWLGLVTLVLLIPFMLYNKKRTERKLQMEKEQLRDNRKKDYYRDVFFNDNVQFEVKLNNIGSYFIGKYKETWQKLYKINKTEDIKHNIINTLIMIINVSSEFLVLTVSVFDVVNKHIGIGDLQYNLSMVSRLRSQSQMLMNKVNKFLNDNTRLIELQEFMDIEPEVEKSGTLKPSNNPKIEFCNVSFRYPNAEQYVLKDCSFTIEPHEKIGLIGLNGAGKSTIIKLMCRLYDPTEGEIYMNDFNVRKYDYRQYLDLFSVVFQDYSLLALPLGNNVSSAATWDGEKAEKCLREVGFGERYDEMAKGLETPIYKNFDDEGVNVSGGEAQKIALARALYKDAPFIILDEPTAALDPIAEAEIYAKFDEIVGDKTAIYISHRLSSCRFCDKIAVFDNGEIVQVGSHEELLSDENGKYYELWTAQAQYYTK